MKKKLLILLGIFSTGLLYAQVGINTVSPSGIFHVDPLNNTNGTTNTADDVVISMTGNVGIGTTTPSNKLSIVSTGTNTGLHLPNGAGTGKVLTSDVNGNGTWNSPGFSEFSQMPGYAGSTIPFTSSQFYYTGYQFKLKEKGTYFITLSCIITINTTTSITFANLAIGRSGIILRSTNNPNDYTNNAIRFVGTYEQTPTILDPVNQARTSMGMTFNLNQTLTTVNDYQDVYIILWVNDAVTLRNNGGSFDFRAGETGSQTSGGSYVRIN